MTYPVPTGRRHALLEFTLREQASDDEEAHDGREEDHEDDPFHDIACLAVGYQSE